MKYFLRILAIIGSVAMLSAVPSIAKAACLPFTMPLSGPAVINVDPTVPVGTSLWSANVSVGATTADSCIGGTATLTYNGVGARENTWYTYQTAVPGIGVRMKYLSGSMSNGTWFPWSWTANWTIGTIGAHTLFVEFIKTGPITVSGSVSGLLATWDTNLVAAPVWGQYVWSSPVMFNVAVPTCTVTTPSISVPMGSIPVSSFTGVGSTSGGQPLNISLSCAGGVSGSYTNVYTTLTDATNPANVSDTLSLTAASTATGVGIQVLNGATVVSYGPDSNTAGNTNQWFAGAAMNGAFNIPLTARYVQTSSTVTPGTANGRATFTMNYQ